MKQHIKEKIASEIISDLRTEGYVNIEISKILSCAYNKNRETLKSKNTEETL